MEVIPAIDLSAGRLARWTPEGPAPVDAFGGDPLAAAEAFAAAGATRVHVVDMDLAFAGEARNLDVLWRIGETGLVVQASGGVQIRSDVEAMLGAGAERVVLGTAGLAERPEAEQLIEEFGTRLVLGLEVRDGRLTARGRRTVTLDLAATLAWLRPMNPARFLWTRVDRVGELSGPDVDGVRALVRETGRPVVAAGGIAGLADLQALAEAGAEAAVLGTVLYEGGIDLGDALRDAAAP